MRCSILSILHRIHHMRAFWKRQIVHVCNVQCNIHFTLYARLCVCAHIHETRLALGRITTTLVYQKWYGGHCQAHKLYAWQHCNHSANSV